jgi:hypothetical protein
MKTALKIIAAIFCVVIVLNLIGRSVEQDVADQRDAAMLQSVADELAKFGRENR